MSAIWTLKPGSGHKLKQGHPWALATEFENLNLKGFINGSAVEIRDAKGEFVARGYGNSESQILFRAMTWQESEREYFSAGWIKKKLFQVWKHKYSLGFTASFRLSFSEADGLPGLMIDRYLLAAPRQCSDQQESHLDAQKMTQVFCCQVSTAGMQKIIGADPTFLIALADEINKAGLSTVTKDNTAVVFRNDIHVRKFEGLEVEGPRILCTPRGIDFKKAEILIGTSQGDKFITMSCDLLEGQKTGFFLDQKGNIDQVLELADKYWGSRSTAESRLSRPLRILDLCCYVGHWSARIAQWARANQLSLAVTLVDVSAEALALAQKNTIRQIQAEPSDLETGLMVGSTTVTTKKLDVLKDLQQFESESFDLIIADPPAFIKSKKDLATGSHAYLKFNTESFRILAPGGLLISCSCSGHMDENSFREILFKAQNRVFDRNADIVILGRGGLSLDHTVRHSYPDGNYLKMFVQKRMLSDKNDH